MMIQRTIPSSGEELAVIGLGTWQTFDVNKNAYPHLADVAEAMYTGGGRLIDSSPMYGKAEQVVGEVMKDRFYKDEFFYATKVWTRGKAEGIEQMEASMRKMGRTTIDLMQIHNLTDWKTQLATLREWKEQGRIRYTGITHYTDSMHEALEQIIKTEQVDFVQVNYSITDTNAARRLLPVAAERGVATIINRPFGEGELLRKVKGKPLPAWATDKGIQSLAVLFLKYIIANLAVTCVIPATGDAAHAADNMIAGEGWLPDEGERKMMATYMKAL